MNYIVLGLLAVVFLICTVTDLRERKIYNVVTFTAIALIIVIRIFHHPQGIVMYLWGLIPAIIFYLIAVLTKGRGTGGGDILLILFLGLSTGILGAFMGILYASILTLLFAAVRYVVSGKKERQLPMAPFLTLGVLLFYLQPLWLAPLINIS
ncbi:prepilin peptidase [Paenibacillus pasadenensis]|uniref:prepilin peptidase n=1 Tax=Paenibacillus pasadenensis TaxID=217090 RepID=UPI0013E3E1B4|nr:A24 family peptidase [Paenibacillus pasadenensis]